LCSSVAVDDFDIARTSLIRAPMKADAPLIVNANA